MARLRRKPWAQQELQGYDFVYKLPKEFKGIWTKIFPNPNPLFLELGCGKGQFITALAFDNPDKNFIGVEKLGDVLVYAARKVVEKELSNVILLEMDVGRLTEVFSDGEVSGIYLNFSDPWPKRRHAKRRLTHKKFLQQYKKIIRPGGFIKFKSDNRGLYQFSLQQLEENGFKIVKKSTDLHNSSIPIPATTEYEDKFTAEGKPIFYIKAQLD